MMECDEESMCFLQRYLVATLGDTKKVERLGTFVRRIRHPWTCRVVTQHLFHSIPRHVRGFFFNALELCALKARKSRKFCA